MIERSESGMLTLWVGGLALVLMLFGAIVLDGWRVIRIDQSVGDMAERTAKAGANGIDEARYRGPENKLVIDEGRAEAIAWDHLEHESDATLLTGAEVEASQLRNEVTVVLSREVPFLLLDVFMPGEEPMTVHRRATARPERST